MNNNVPFLYYYLKFAKKHPNVKKVIEEYDVPLVLHSIKPFLEEYYFIIFNYNMKNYFDAYIAAKNNIYSDIKLEIKKKKEVLDKTKKKLLKNIVKNTTINICCFVNDKFDDNNKYIFPKKIFSYLPKQLM